MKVKNFLNHEAKIANANLNLDPGLIGYKPLYQSHQICEFYLVSLDRILTELWSRIATADLERIRDFGDEQAFTLSTIRPSA